MDQAGMVAGRPLPELEPHSLPFWEGARQRRLRLQRCGECQKVQFPPEICCAHCGSENIEWFDASGRATLYTWTVTHPPLLPFFGERAPWPVVAVELEEGVRMVSRIVDLPVESYEIGLPLVADFEVVDPEISLVVFRPA